MKTILILSTLLATTAIAAAQPSLTATATPEPAQEPSHYLQLGGVFGGTQGAMILGETVEGGMRLDHGPLWVHAEVMTGSAGGVDELTYSGSVLQVRAGLEARGCALNGIACVVGGVDAAYSRTQYMAEDDNDNRHGGEIIPRVGLDIGSERLRVRPGVEVGFDHTGWDQLGFTAALAYQW
ncbi:MAG TPA: hypothetical protein VMJ10_10110 [Kofleriaceae bacterium]|nr:hypothetical protein [Kofleriaceae bacterium]